MHLTAEQNAKRFFNTYVSKKDGDIKILEIGSYIGGFSIRSLSNEKTEYIGVDLTKGPGVDIVLEDQYVLPFEDNTFDFVISSSCFEHSEFFWLNFIEIMRVLKIDGLFYLNAPSGGMFHRYPVDCWRFFPDSGQALANWGKRNRFNCDVLEQYTSNKETDIWSDYVCIFIKDISEIDKFNERIIDSFNSYTNGSVYPNKNFKNLLKW
jgi:SAM-dependent methyltransferase